MPPRPFRIIAIDNDAALGQRLLTAFWGPGYAFHWFADGREALGALEELRPDVIVCELMLPGLHGRAVLEAVRLRSAFQDVPFLVLSSIRSDAIIDSMLEAGATAYLVKPCSVAQLKEAIRAVLENVPRPAGLDLAEGSSSVVPVSEPPSRPVEQAPVQAPVESPIAGDGRLAAPGERETGAGTEDAPPPPVLAKGRRAKRARSRDRKRKSQDAAPSAAEPTREPVEPAAATFAAAASQLFEPSEPRLTSVAASGPSGIVSWGRTLRVAAALLAIGVMSDRQSRDPLPDGVTARTNHEPSDTPIDPSPSPAMQAPEAADPSPEPSAELAAETPRPALETPRPAPRNVDPLVRGRLQWAQSLYDDGRYDDARAALSEVVKLAPTNMEARHLASQLERFATRLPGSVQRAAEEDERAVLALLWRYQTALEHRDVASLEEIWPTVDTDAMLARWRDAPPPRRLALRLASLEVTSDQAVAMCVSYDSVAAAAGEQASGSARLSFHLKRANGSWVIADVS